MATCTFCGESTRNYVEYAQNGVFCSPEHREYHEMRNGRSMRYLSTEENSTRTGQSNSGYIWQPRAVDDAHRVASNTSCAYCGKAPHGSIEHFAGRVYCSGQHRIYDERKRNGDSDSTGGGGRHANETDCQEGSSHAGYMWQP